MPIQPEDLSISGLPRSTLPGGIKADAAADLLQRAAWDYREALKQISRLARTVEEQALRIEALEVQLMSSEADASTRKTPDEVGRALLEAAQRTARERREEARREAELLLKKAARRAEMIELAARRRLENGAAELEQLQAFREELSRGLRSTLEAIVELGADGRSADIAISRPVRENMTPWR
jgi:hypothetical protein